MNQQPKCKSNAIYAVNHSCCHDIPYVCESVNKHCYVLVGKQPLKIIDRIAFCLNGVVWVDRKDKQSKRKSVEKMSNILKSGGNMVIYSEGTWNLTPSKPMLPLYWGVIDLARTTKTPIIPVILEYIGDKCYVMFGDCINVGENDSKSSKINELRDVLAAMRWHIWECADNCGFDTADEWQSEVERRLHEYPKLNYEYEKSVIRKEYDMDDKVFEFMLKLQPAFGNAFLFNKRNHN